MTEDEKKALGVEHPTKESHPGKPGVQTFDSPPQGPPPPPPPPEDEEPIG